MEQVLNQEAPHFTDASFPRPTNSFAEYKNGEGMLFYFPVLVGTNKANYIQTEIGLLRALTRISVGGNLLTYARFVTQEIMNEETLRQEEAKKPARLPDSYSISNLRIVNGRVIPFEQPVPSKNTIKTAAFTAANISARNKNR